MTSPWLSLLEVARWSGVCAGSYGALLFISIAFAPDLQGEKKARRTPGLRALAYAAVAAAGFITPPSECPASPGVYPQGCESKARGVSTPHGRGGSEGDPRGALSGPRVPDAAYTAPTITGPGLEGSVAHRAELHLGDCLDVMRAMPDGSVDFVFTDPPYGNNQNDGDMAGRLADARGLRPSELPRTIHNDGDEAHGLVRLVMPELRRLLRPGAVAAVCCAGGGGAESQSYAEWTLCMAEHFDFKQMVVWDKGPMGLGWHYRRSYEVILVGQVPGAACRWFDSSGRVENVIRPGDYGVRKIIPAAEDHPTPKPIELPAHFLSLHTRPGDVVLDPFMGGGSTGVACARTGRSFVGAELDPAFFELSRARIEEAVMDLGHKGSLFEDLARGAAVQSPLFDSEDEA